MNTDIKAYICSIIGFIIEFIISGIIVGIILVVLNVKASYDTHWLLTILTIFILNNMKMFDWLLDILVRLFR